MTGIREGNRLPTVPKFQFAATANYGTRFNDNVDWYVNGSVQHVGNRWAQPGDQEPGVGFISNASWFDPVTGSPASGINDIGSLKLPAYTIWPICRRA